MADEDELVYAIPPAQIAVFREVVAENLAANLARCEAFERRATTLLGVVTASLTILLAGAGLGVGAGAAAALWGLLPTAVGIILLIGCAYYCVATLRPRKVRAVGASSIVKLWRQQKACPGDAQVQVWAKILNDTIEPARPAPEETGAETAKAESKPGVKKVSVLQAAADEAAARGEAFKMATRWMVAGLSCVGVAIVVELGARMWA